MNCSPVRQLEQKLACRQSSELLAGVVDLDALFLLNRLCSYHCLKILFSRQSYIHSPYSCSVKQCTVPASHSPACSSQRCPRIYTQKTQTADQCLQYIRQISLALLHRSINVGDGWSCKDHCMRRHARRNWLRRTGFLWNYQTK